MESLSEDQQRTASAYRGDLLLTNNQMCKMVDLLNDLTPDTKTKFELLGKVTRRNLKRQVAVHAALLPVYALLSNVGPLAAAAVHSKFKTVLASVLSRAACSDHPNVIKAALSGLSQAQRLELLMDECNASLHISALLGHKRCIKAIRNLLEPKNLLVLMSKRYTVSSRQISDLQDCDNSLWPLWDKISMRFSGRKIGATDLQDLDNSYLDKTPMDLALMHGNGDAFALLRDYKLRAEETMKEKVSSLDKVRGDSGCDSECDLSAEEAKRSSTVGLVFFTEEGRDGGTEEAVTLKSSLAKVADQVSSYDKWLTANDLLSGLESRVPTLDSSCSLLIVSFMSHGEMGVLRCPDGSLVSINSLIDRISRAIPASLTLVVLVQACQAYPGVVPPRSDLDAASTPNDTPHGSANDCRHIDLLRPNTVLLRSAVSGGFSGRGVYITELAEEIGKADGIKTLHQMHTDAVKAMREEWGTYLDEINACPEYRDTMYGKQVVFSKVAN